MDRSQRYIRQTQFEHIGPEGQNAIARSRVAVIGQGALGCASSGYLARAGVGHLRIVDTDRVDWSNLQRQILFDEADIGREKALAAAAHLRRINSDIDIQPVSARLDDSNAMAILADADLVIDASDNFEARTAVNSACLRLGIPWIYAGVVGSKGMTMNMLPGGPCLRCVMPDKPPERGEYAVASIDGIIGPLPPLFAAIQCSEALKILTGAESVRRTLLYMDLWSNAFEEIAVKRNPCCKTCSRKE